MCFSRGDRSPPKRRGSRRVTNPAPDGSGSTRWARIRSSRMEENLIHERALAAAILFQQQLQNGGGTVAFDRSASLRYPNGNSKRNQALPRSSSSRARSLTDPLLQPHQLVNQVIGILAIFGMHSSFVVIVSLHRWNHNSVLFLILNFVFLPE